MKRKAILAIVFFLLFFMFSFPKITLEAAREGLLLWFRTLLPSLLPFMILSNFLISFNCVGKILNPFRKIWSALFGLTPYGAYVLLLGTLCGYPMGAKLTGDLLLQGQISRQEGKYLLTFTSNASPMFICTYLVLECIGDERQMLPVFFILYLSSYLSSICFRIYYGIGLPQGKLHKKTETSSSYPTGTLIDVSIMNGFETITKLCGYILLFSIAAKAASQLLCWMPRGKYLLLGTLEISTGLFQIARSALGFPWKFSLLVSFTAFGGFCVLFQSKGVLAKSGLSILPYLAGKVLAALFAFLLSWIYLSLIQVV
ncbi:MAG TPA: hypothetical protein IAA11_07095 [Candidatus Blautia intestinigallinarum]|nr:hypothetical protein [Candidatus Blautia intestinigallinarum]